MNYGPFSEVMTAGTSTNLSDPHSTIIQTTTKTLCLPAYNSNTPFIKHVPKRNDEFCHLGSCKNTLPENFTTVWHLSSHITLCNLPHTLISSPGCTLWLSELRWLSLFVPMLGCAGPRVIKMKEGGGDLRVVETRSRKGLACQGGSSLHWTPEPLLSCSWGKPFNTRVILRRGRPRSPAFHASATNEV